MWTRYDMCMRPQESPATFTTTKAADDTIQRVGRQSSVRAHSSIPASIIEPAAGYTTIPTTDKCCSTFPASCDTYGATKSAGSVAATSALQWYPRWSTSTRSRMQSVSDDPSVLASRVFGASLHNHLETTVPRLHQPKVLFTAARSDGSGLVYRPFSRNSRIVPATLLLLEWFSTIVCTERQMVCEL